MTAQEDITHTSHWNTVWSPRLNQFFRSVSRQVVLKPSLQQIISLSGGFSLETPVQSSQLGNIVFWDQKLYFESYRACFFGDSSIHCSSWYYQPWQSWLIDICVMEWKRRGLSSFLQLCPSRSGVELFPKTFWAASPTIQPWRIIAHPQTRSCIVRRLLWLSWS